MKERPILFSATIVRAILSSTKTQTRRVVKPQPAGEIRRGEPDFNHWIDTKYWERQNQKENRGIGTRGFACPYGQPGDRLWVRETWRTDARLDDKAPNEFSGWPVKYEADSAVLNHGAFFGQTDGKTRTSIHMPRWASRITLEVTGVRVERLHACNEVDAIAEGAPWAACGAPQGGSHKAGFAQLWEQINGHGSWEANPWVWVIEFRRLP